MKDQLVKRQGKGAYCDIQGFFSLDKISLPVGNGYVFFELNNIVRCEGQNNYTCFHMINCEKIVVAKTLGRYEELLRDYRFFRIHKSHLINLAYICRYVRDDGGYVLMADNTQLGISRRKLSPFLKMLKDR